MAARKLAQFATKLNRPLEPQRCGSNPTLSGSYCRNPQVWKKTEFWPQTLTLQMKGRWESNMNVWFPLLYSQKWNCAVSLFPKQNYNVLFSFCFQIPTLIYLWEIYIFPPSVCLFCCSGPILEYINRSQTHECRNWDWSHASPFPEIHKFDFRYCADKVKHRELISIKDLKKYLSHKIMDILVFLPLNPVSNGKPNLAL